MQEDSRATSKKLKLAKEETEKLHEEIKHQLPKPQSLFEAYKEIIPAVIKRSKNPDYYIPVKIPNF